MKDTPVLPFDLPATTQSPNFPVGAPNPNDDDDWCQGEDNIVVELQPRTAIYENQLGHVVIRQEAEVFEDNPYVTIAPEFLDRFIHRLTQLRDALKGRRR
jgi:hypothetical protein